MTREEIIKSSKNLRDRIRNLSYIPAVGATAKDKLLRGCINVAISADFKQLAVVCQTADDEQRIKNVIGSEFAGMPLIYIVPSPSTNNS